MKWMIVISNYYVCEELKKREKCMDFVLASAAAVCAGFFTNPLEVMKTRMQLQGELTARGKYEIRYKHVFHAGYVIAKHDGIFALQAGLVPALWFQCVLNGYRLGTYQILVDKGVMKDKNGELVFWKSTLTAGAIGGSGAFIASPFYLVKVHFQSKASKEIAFGQQYNYEGTWSALKNIYREFGIKGLFRGATAAIPRATVGSMAQLTSFAYTKQYLKEHAAFSDSPVLLSFVASMIGGTALCAAMTPFDLVSTRMYNQGVSENGKGLLYDNYFDCVKKIWKSEGVLGFYKGIGPSYLRVGPHSVLCLVFWDYFKNLYEKFGTQQL